MDKWINAIIINIIPLIFTLLIYYFFWFKNRKKYEEELTEIRKTMYTDSVLNFAISNGNVSTVEEYIVDGGDVNRTLHSNHTLLMQSCLYSHSYKISELLLKNGANVNMLIKDNVSALAISIMSRNFDAIKLLLQYGADVQLPALNTGISILQFAKEMLDVTQDKQYADVLDIIACNKFETMFTNDSYLIV